jgi:hypothetical protein
MVVMRCPDPPDLAGLDGKDDSSDDHITPEQDEVSIIVEAHVLRVCFVC